MPRLTSNQLTRAEFLSAIDSIAILQTRIRLLTAKRDKHIQHVQDEYQPDIGKAEEQLVALLAQAERFADTHRDELFRGKEKTSETQLASYGYRIHPPALKTLNRKWTWETVLAAVQRTFPGRFVRKEEALQKDALKAELSVEQLATVGLRIDQPETFGVTPKVDGAQTETV